MEYEKFKKILLKFYADPYIYKIISGYRRPSYPNMYKMYESYEIPLEIWNDVDKYIIKNDDESNK